MAFFIGNPVGGSGRPVLPFKIRSTELMACDYRGHSEKDIVGLMFYHVVALLERGYFNLAFRILDEFGIKGMGLPPMTWEEFVQFVMETRYDAVEKAVADYPPISEI